MRETSREVSSIRGESKVSSERAGRRLRVFARPSRLYLNPLSLHRLDPRNFKVKLMAGRLETLATVVQGMEGLKDCFGRKGKRSFGESCDRVVLFSLTL